MTDAYGSVRTQDYGGDTSSATDPFAGFGGQYGYMREPEDTWMLLETKHRDRALPMELLLSTNNVNVVESWLDDWNGYGECQLVDYWSERYCLDVAILIDNIWECKRQMRHDLDTPDLTLLKFINCERLHIENALRASWLETPDEIPWGINEFADIRVSLSDTEEFLAFEIIWEGSDHKKLSIVYKSVAIFRLNAGGNTLAPLEKTV